MIDSKRSKKENPKALLLQRHSALRRAHQNYAKAVSVGGYDAFLGGLRGKHDNVRVFWEDQNRRRAMRPPLARLKRLAGDFPLRVLDLGCGAGQGIELLARIERNPRSLEFQHDWILPESEMSYVGVDLSPEMVAKGREVYRGRKNLRFEVGDLNEGLGALRREAPFDVYYSSYGSFSHLSAERLSALLTDIFRHARPGAVVVLDLNARYSIEWPGYWMARSERGKTRDYTMNYLYLGDEAGMRGAEHFPLRFWTGEEVRDLVEGAARKAGTDADLGTLMDCSILVGRHVDTGEYNPKVKPWRSLVNSLHQDFSRTSLTALLIDPDVAGTHRVASPFLKTLIEAWNTLVRFTRERLKGPVTLFDRPGWSDYPACLQFALMGMDRVITDAQWMHYGDPRANFVEPQLGYMLRSLEVSLQQGLGCGHALVAVIEVKG